MQLIKLWEADVEKAYELQMSFEKDENGFMNAAYGLSFEEFKGYVEKRKGWSSGVGLPEGFVPDTVFVLEDEGNYVGIFNMRHHLNDFLESGAGHLGFGISKKYRQKGYATKGLALLLEEAKKIGIEEVYLSVNKDNPYSLKAQLKNGAYIHHEDELEYYTRIKLL